MVLYFPNSLLPSIYKDIKLLFLFLSPSLNAFTYSVIGNINSNGVTISSKYPISYLELLFVFN